MANGLGEAFNGLCETLCHARRSERPSTHEDSSHGWNGLGETLYPAAGSLPKLFVLKKESSGLERPTGPRRRRRRSHS